MTEGHKAQNGLLILREYRHSIPLDQFHSTEIPPRGKLDAMGHLLFWERPPLSEL